MGNYKVEPSTTSKKPSEPHMLIDMKLKKVLFVGDALQCEAELIGRRAQDKWLLGKEKNKKRWVG